MELEKILKEVERIAALQDEREFYMRSGPHNDMGWLLSIVRELAGRVQDAIIWLKPEAAIRTDVAELLAELKGEDDGTEADG